jgi:hypothetical protein
MELKINEYNTYFTDANRNLQEPRTNTNKISFDDILSSLTMNVVDGKIQLTSKNTNYQEQLDEGYESIPQQFPSPPPPVPQLTLQQYRRQLFFLHLNQQEEIRRIRALKSRQLFFSRNFDSSAIRASAPQQAFHRPYKK